MKSSLPIIKSGYGSLKSLGGGLKDNKNNNMLLDVRENMDEEDSDSEDLVSLDGPQKED